MANTEPRPLTEVEQMRLAAATAEVRAIVEAAKNGTLDAEALEAGLAAVAQVPLDTERLLDALHVPDDAGEWREGLERILRRIPDGWGRWISCGPGWYPIVVRLADEIATILPEYEIHQVKEKYGTLRFYWGVPDRQLTCCQRFNEEDPRPGEGAIIGPFAPKHREAGEQQRLEAWFARFEAHLASDEHRRCDEAAHAAVVWGETKAIGARIEALIDAAEAASAATCENCGEPGELHEHTGWLRTLCSGCAGDTGYVLCREQ